MNRAWRMGVAALVLSGGCFAEPSEIDPEGSTSQADTGSATQVNPSTTSVGDGEPDSSSTTLATETTGTGSTGSTGDDATGGGPPVPSMLRFTPEPEVLFNDAARVGSRLIAVGTSLNDGQDFGQSVIAYIDGPGTARFDEPLEDDVADELYAIATNDDATSYAAVGRAGDAQTFGASVILGDEGGEDFVIDIRTQFGEDLSLEATAVARGENHWLVAGTVQDGSMFLAQVDDEGGVPTIDQYTSVDADAMLRPLAIAVGENDFVLSAVEVGVAGRRAVVARGNAATSALTNAFVLSGTTSMRIFDIVPSPWRMDEWLLVGEYDDGMLVGGFDPNNEPMFSFVSNASLPPARAAEMDAGTVWIAGESVEGAGGAVFVGTVTDRGAVTALELSGLTLNPGGRAPLEAGAGRATLVAAGPSGSATVVPVSGMLSTSRW